MSIQRKNIDRDFEIIGVFATSAGYLEAIRKTAEEEGMIFYDTTLKQLRMYNGSSWVPAGSSGTTELGSLDYAATIGAKITSVGSIEIEYTSPSASLLILDSDGTGTADVLDISQAGGATHLINLTQEGTGDDIDGTGSLWSVAKDGVGSFASLVLIDDQPLNLGTNTDAVLQWDQSKLALSAAADSTFQIGAAAFSYDVSFIGNTSVANLMKWDLDGGADTVGALVFDNADIDLGDNDQIRIGDVQDWLLYWDDTYLYLTPAANNSPILLGSATRGVDLSVYGDTATSILQWYAAGDRLVFKSAAAAYDDGLQLDDWVGLTFGTGANFGSTGSGDWQMYSSGAANNPLFIMPTTDDSIITVGNAGGTLNADLAWYTGTAASGFFIDQGANKVYLDAADFALGDDDYLLFGDVATAGGTTDATIRWDNTSAVLEIIGNTQFEDDVQVDGSATVTGDLTVAGAFALAGGFDPGDLTLSDDETFSFGVDSDITMKWDQTQFLIDGYAADTAIWIGKTNNQDLVIYGDSSNDAITFDTSAESCSFNGFDLTLQDGDKLILGTSSDVTIQWDETELDVSMLAANGVINIGKTVLTDVIMQGLTGDADLHWDNSADTLGLLDNAKIGFGNTATDPDVTITWDAAELAIDGVSANTGIVFGKTTTVDVEFAGAAKNAQWDADKNMLAFADSAILGFGGTKDSAADITMKWDETQLVFSGAAPNTAIHIGDATNLDLVINGGTTTNNITFDTDDSALSCTFEEFDLKMNDGAHVYFGDSTNDAMILWDETELVIQSNTPNATIAFGKTVATDITFNGTTDSYDCEWNASSNMMHFLDDAVLGIGGAADAAADITFVWDSTAGKLLVTGAADHNQIRIGDAVNLDVVICGETTTSSITFDTDDTAKSCTFDVFDLHIGDTDHIYFGDSTNDAMIVWDGSELVIQSNTANATIAFGKTIATDVSFNGTTAGTDCEWNASSNMLQFVGQAVLGLGGAADAAAAITMAWDGTSILLVDGAAEHTTIAIGKTNNQDLIIYGETSTSSITFDTDNTAKSCIFNVFDLHIGDEDSIYLGDSTSDSKISWDKSELVLQAGTANGTIAFGKSVATDITFNGTTAGTDCEWNASANMLHFLDNAVLGIGGAADASADITMSWDSTAGVLVVTGAAPDNEIRIGDTTNLDIVICGGTTTNNITFDTDDAALSCTFEEFDLKINDDAHIYFGDSTNDSMILWDQSELVLQSNTANGTIAFGKTVATDITFNGTTAGVDCEWNASANMLHFIDNAVLGIGGVADAAADISMTWDSTNNKLLIDGANANTTIQIGAANQQDLVICGATSTRTVTFDVDDTNHVCVFDGFNLKVSDDDRLYLGDQVADCPIYWDQTQAQINPSSEVRIGDVTNFTSIGSTGNITFGGTANVVCNSGASFGGLQIPFHASSTPSGAAGSGAMFFEIDASKLYVNIGGTEWLSSTFS